MKYRIYLMGTALLLLLAAGMFAILKPGTQAPSLTDQSKSEKSVASATVADKTGAMIPAKESKSNDRKRPELKNSDLVSKYGESRVNLSRQITNDMVSIMNDLIEMGGKEGMKKMISRDESKNSSESEVAAVLGTVSESLNLTADQLSKTEILLAGVKRRKMAALQEMLKQTSKDPTAMMTALLISDAAARREIDEPEFKRLKSEAENLMGDPSDFFNFDAGAEIDLLKDHVFVRDLKSLLNPEQQMMVENELKNQTANDKPDDSKADESEYMKQTHLEEIDTLTSSAKKMMSGLKTVIEGMKSLPKSDSNSNSGNQ
jgi:hypothetical protein